MGEQYRVQLNLISLVKVMAMVGFGVGVVIGIAFFIWSLMNGLGLASAIVTALVSPFSNSLTLGAFGLIGYPFYNWFCLRNRGQVLGGKFMKVEQQPTEASD